MAIVSGGRYRVSGYLEYFGGILVRIYMPTVVVVMSLSDETGSLCTVRLCGPGYPNDIFMVPGDRLIPLVEGDEKNTGCSD